MGPILEIMTQGKVFRNTEMPGSVLAPVSAGDDDFRDWNAEFFKCAVDQRIAGKILCLGAEADLFIAVQNPVEIRVFIESAVVVAE